MVFLACGPRRSLDPSSTLAAMRQPRALSETSKRGKCSVSCLLLVKTFGALPRNSLVFWACASQNLKPRLSHVQVPEKCSCVESSQACVSVPHIPLSRSRPGFKSCLRTRASAVDFCTFLKQKVGGLSSLGFRYIFLYYNHVAWCAVLHFLQLRSFRHLLH